MEWKGESECSYGYSKLRTEDRGARLIGEFDVDESDVEDDEETERGMK